MTTLNELRQRIENEYIEPVNEETPATTLTADMTAVATSFAFTSGVFSPDEESYIVAGRLLELDNELVRITGYDQSTSTITCKRGARDTTIVAHTQADCEVRIPTRWPRASVLMALRAAIAGLWQPLYATQETQATIDTTRYISLPPNTVRIMGLEYEDTNGEWKYLPVKLIRKHPLDPSRAAARTPEVPFGNRVCLITYATTIEAPVDDDETIADLPVKYERIVIADAASELLSGVDVDAVTQERLTEQMRLEGFPVRSGSTISQNLIRFHAYLVDRANKELIAQYPRRVARSKVNLWRA